ncbi:MAG: anaerobic ribonucleoside-triphosphate reductase activating protein [Candidatus Saccharibacteria bacterium]|nr:anaerobic ribonucleoside-triphosphate reductase activating protein [Candidatus Saccharibacteria bacterium]
MPSSNWQPPKTWPQVPVGGVQKLTLVDYPGHVAAALFTAGCNMRCGYCHNPELVLPERLAPSIPLDDIFIFLEKRRGRLNGVVVSGGEPTVHEELPELCRLIKSLGYDVKLDSNGTHPAMLAEMIKQGWIDFVSMDIKGPLEKYIEIAARPIDLAAIQESIRLLIDSGVGYEFRTTVVRQQLAVEDFIKIGQMIKGAKTFALQHFRPGKTLSPQFAEFDTFTEEEFAAARAIMERYVGQCIIR